MKIRRVSVDGSPSSSVQVASLRNNYNIDNIKVVGESFVPTAKIKEYTPEELEVFAKQRGMQVSPKVYAPVEAVKTEGESVA